jgi:hypothetical protein
VATERVNRAVACGSALVSHCRGQRSAVAVPGLSVLAAPTVDTVDGESESFAHGAKCLFIEATSTRIRLFVQLHNSLAGGKLPQGEMDEVVLPAPALVPDPELVPDPALDVDPRLEPKPPRFGLVGALQNVAVISSWQIIPVLGSSELFIVPPAPSACCRDCATPGEDAKSSAAINASFSISGISKVRSKRTGGAFNPPNVLLNIWLHSPSRPADASHFDFTRDG